MSMIITTARSTSFMMRATRLRGSRLFLQSHAVSRHARSMVHVTRPNCNGDRYDKHQVNAMVGHNFPDYIEWWNRDTFRKVGYGLSGLTAASFAGPALWAAGVVSEPLLVAPSVLLGVLTAGYWRLGLEDIKQTNHAIRRNYPVLGNMRYVLEMIRPEIRQYLVESDLDGRPYDRLRRTQIYQRAKNVDDTMSFGTRRNVYEVHHEWACHSMWPVTVETEEAKRYSIGTAAFGTTRPYSSSVFNISGMSYGAISDHAILALNGGAALAGCSQNTGEGGVSRFHTQGDGDLVWNVGTGYFGCGSGTGENRIFEPAQFKETIEGAAGQIKMIELKLSQGAKPGHGGLLPKAKITEEIALTRKLDFPPTHDCHSPARHSSFSNAHELVEFIGRVRETSGGLPVGVKLCVGDPGDIVALCKAILEVGTGPDFITVDGAEGGTGAAPPELSNSVGWPLEEGIVLVRNLLVGSGLKDKVAINASGRVSSGFSVVRTLALGADITSAARAFMMSIGCIQALKCNTNKCPTGIATLNKDLMFGLDPELKSSRVYHYHRKTMMAASDIVGIMGKTSFADVTREDIMRRTTSNEVQTLLEQFPEVEAGCLLNGDAPSRLQQIWQAADRASQGSTRRWIY